MTHINNFIQSTKPVEWLVEGLIPRGQRGLVVAQPAGGKSWWLEHLALCVASGQKFLNKYPVLQPESVLIVDQDTPTTVLSDRLRALTKPDAHRVALAVASHQGLSLDLQSGIDRLLELARSRKPSLIILETLDTLTSGRFNENNAADAGTFFDHLNQVIAEIGCTVLLSHHFSKNRQGDNPLAWIRGSSVLPSRIDFGYALQPLTTLASDSKKFLVSPFSKRMKTPLAYQFELRTTAQQGRLSTANLQWVSDWDLGLDPDVADKAHIIIELVKEAGREGITVTAILKVGAGYLSDQQVRHLLDFLRQEGRIIRGRESHGRFRFWVPGYAPHPPVHQ